MSGWLARRWRAATASGRSWPLAIRPATVFMPKAVKSTSPEATAVNSAPASLNGTCSMLHAGGTREGLDRHVAGVAVAQRARS